MWLYGSGESVGAQDTLYRIDHVGRDKPEVVAQGPAVTNSDGASCPFTIGMEKTVDRPAACAGTTVTYRYEITNEAIDADPAEGAATVSADFVDQLPDDGRTFVAGSLVNPLGGDVAAYGGTDRLRIDDLAIPHDSTATIQVAVALPVGHGSRDGDEPGSARRPDRQSRYPGPLRVPRDATTARRHASRRPELRRHQRGQVGRRRGGRAR